MSGNGVVVPLGTAYEKRLFEKLDEEVTKLRGERGADELADVVELLDALRAELGVGEGELERVSERTAAERGRFEEGVVLDRVGD